MNKWIRWMCVVWALFFPTGIFGVANEEVAGSEEAIRWIKLIDAAQYDVAFKEMEPAIQVSLKMEDWVLGLAKVRTPLGKLQERKIKTAFFTTELPGAPSGEYVVVQFKSQFESRSKAALETITLMRGNDSTWLVSGYFIQ